MSPPSDHPTRTALLDAGLRLAATLPLSRLSVNRIVQAAGVAKGTFYVHFLDRDSYLVALHAHFHTALNTTIDQTVEGLPPGRQNLQYGTIAYLDGCLQQRPLKALLVEARVAPGVATAVQQRNQLYYATVAADLAAMDWPQPLLAARLYVTMVAEAALIEMEQGQVVTALRDILWQFLDSQPGKRPDKAD